jgi:hypothetical protein
MRRGPNNLNLRYADDGILFGSVAEVSRAYQILKDEGQKYCFFLVPHQTSLWWLTMDCVRSRLLFDCRLDVDVKDLPLRGIVLVGSPVGSDEFVKQHLSAKSAKIDVVLGMIADMDNAQIAMPLHRFCLSVVLFTSVFRNTPLEQTPPAAAMLDKQQRFWIYRLLPSLPLLRRRSCARRPYQ